MHFHRVAAPLALPCALALIGCPPASTGGDGDDDDEDEDGNEDEAADDDDADAGPTIVDGGIVVDEPADFFYAPVAGSVCANGTGAGIGLAPVVASDELVILFYGGGACWDALTCFGLNSATHLSTTYDQATLDADTAALALSGLTDRARTDTPFARASMAFLPYCTADLYAGDAVREVQADLLGLDIRSVHHKGRPNVIAFLGALATAMPDITRVWVVGLSAGGYGAVLSYDLIVGAFPFARVDMIVDGAPFVAPQNGVYFTWQTQWNMQVPACEGCDTDFGAIIDDVVTRHDEARFALTTTTNDDVIRLYFGFGLNDMTSAVGAVVDLAHDRAHSRAFVIAGTEHVLLDAYDTLVAPDGTTLKDFVDGWAAGDERFITVRPE